MNCYLHPDAPAISYCRTCGRALCAICQRASEGTVYCQEHVPVSIPYAPTAQPGAAGVDPSAQFAGSSYTSAQSSAGPYASGPSSTQYTSAQNPYVRPVSAAIPADTSPGLAFLLGIIPGVGAIYNGQYVKGLVHAVVFGVLIALISSSEHSSAVPLFSMVMVGFVFYMPFEAYHTAKRRQAGIAIDEWSSLVAPNRYTSRAPIGPVLLICFGVLFLLDTLHVFEFREVVRFWPVLLIVAGAVMLYNRVSTTAPGRPQVTGLDTPPVMESRHE